MRLSIVKFWKWRRRARSRTITLPFLSFMLTLVGLFWLVGPDSAFTSQTLDITFALMPRRLWGILVMLAALATLITLQNAPAAILTGLVGMFSLTLSFAVLTGQSESWNAPLWPLMVTGMLTGVLTRVGTKVPPGAPAVSVLAPATHFLHPGELDKAAVTTGEHPVVVVADQDRADGCGG